MRRRRKQRPVPGNGHVDRGHRTADAVDHDVRRRIRCSPRLLTPKYGVGQIIEPDRPRRPGALTVENPAQGAGAYILDPGDTVAGDHYTYDANPDYFDPSRQHYKQIVIQVIANPQAAMNALQSDQIDITAGSAETVSLAEGAGLQIAQTPFVWQGLNLIDRGGEVSEPLGDVRVRQAINYAIDRETVSTALLGDYGVPTATVTVEGGDGWSEAAAARYPYDPDMARQLLAEAGYPDGFKLDVLSVRFAGIDMMAEAVAGQLAEVGIDVNLNHVTDVGSVHRGHHRPQLSGGRRRLRRPADVHHGSRTLLAERSGLQRFPDRLTGTGPALRRRCRRTA